MSERDPQYKPEEPTPEPSASEVVEPLTDEELEDVAGGWTGDGEGEGG